MKVIKFLLKATPLQAERTIEKLELTGDRAIPVMKALLEQGNWHLRLHAVKCLAKLDQPESTELLVIGMRDSLMRVSEEACKALRTRTLPAKVQTELDARLQEIHQDHLRMEETLRQHDVVVQQKKATSKSRYERNRKKHSDLAVHHIGYYQRRKATQLSFQETGSLAIIAGFMIMILSFIGSFDSLPYAGLFFRVISLFCIASGGYQFLRARLVR